MDLRNKIEEQANYSLEAVESAISIVDRQINKAVLPRIRQTIIEISSGNYSHLHELKSLVYGNTPEGSSSDNDIFSLDVQGNGVKKYLGIWLSELINLVEKYLQEN